ncbi:MAG: methylenetetrahydrofolate reductase [NAD(P)H] [Bifidobacteriaceae bacterium]|nr:methylenetetrahydrofolate reductase [NAD(P)H] [Bifidobacteriaceae bacterium]
MFSLEVFPPKRNAAVGTIYDTLDGLQGVDPDFISVTYGTGKQSDRTATARICNTIRQEYDIPVIAHLTAQYLDEQGAAEALEMFEQAKVRGVLALRGDAVPGREPAGVFDHASDLVAFIRRTHPDLTIYGACYPEGHPQSVSLKQDVENLRTKVDAGVSHLISQLFYDNADFLNFVQMARAEGIDVPIEAGIMPVMNVGQVRRMGKLCGARIPHTLDRMLDKWQDDPRSLRAAGIVYASQQISDLVAQGVQGVHLYTMNHPGITRRIWQNVGDLFEVKEQTA